MLLDSNIVIYASKPQYAYLFDFFRKHPIQVSAVSKIEVLGFHALTDQTRTSLEGFFQNIPVLPISEAITEQAIKLRQIKKMTLGDSLVAATALCHALPIATRNVSDFNWIAGLTIVNPIH